MQTWKQQEGGMACIKEMRNQSCLQKGDSPEKGEEIEDLFSQAGGPGLTLGHYVFTNGTRPGCTLVSPGSFSKMQIHRLHFRPAKPDAALYLAC